MATSESLYIQGEVGRIQACYTAGSAGRAAVICHPHPLYGGSMDDAVVAAVERAMRNRGIAVLRFNFRGVGGSEGIHDRGVGEAEDAALLLRWLQEEKGAEQLLLAGYSFGGGVAARVAVSGEIPLERLILVAPALGRELMAVKNLHCPVILLQGELDSMVDGGPVRSWAGQLQPPADCVQLAGADHFFGRQLADIVTALDGRLL